MVRAVRVQNGLPSHAPVLSALFVLRFLERERSGSVQTLVRVGACCLSAGLRPVNGAEEAQTAAMAGNSGDTSQLGSVFLGSTSRGGRPAASSLPRALFGRLPVGLGSPRPAATSAYCTVYHAVKHFKYQKYKYFVSVEVGSSLLRSCTEVKVKNSLELKMSIK